MANFYADMAATALELLAEFGASATIRRWTEAEYDATTGEDATPVPEEFATTVLFQSVSEATGGGGSIRPGSGIGGLDGHLIVEGVRSCIFSAQAEPKVGDKLIIDSTEWDILTVDEIRPNGVDVVAFKCSVQK